MKIDEETKEPYFDVLQVRLYPSRNGKDGTAHTYICPDVCSISKLIGVIEAVKFDLLQEWQEQAINKGGDEWLNIIIFRPKQNPSY